MRTGSLPQWNIRAQAVIRQLKPRVFTADNTVLSEVETIGRRCGRSLHVKVDIDLAHSGPELLGQFREAMEDQYGHLKIDLRQPRWQAERRLSRTF